MNCHAAEVRSRGGLSIGTADDRYIKLDSSNSGETTGDFDFFKNASYGDAVDGNKISILRDATTDRDVTMSFYVDANERARFYSDWDIDIFAEALMYITADSLEIDVSTGYLYLNPGADTDISCFTDNGSIGNTTDGKKFIIKRDALEGDNQMEFYTDQYQVHHLSFDATTKIHATADALLLYADAGGVSIQPYAVAGVDFFSITDVADADDGQPVYIYRMAAEGDDYFKIYGDDDSVTGVITYSGGTISFDDENLTTTGILKVGQVDDASDNISIDPNNRILYDSGGAAFLNWETYTLYDSLGVSSIDTDTRYLYDALGVLALDWSADGVVNFDNNDISTTGAITGNALVSTTNIQIGDGGYIGSASANNALSISAVGDATFMGQVLADNFSDGTLTIVGGNLTTTGTLSAGGTTLDSLVVDTTTLVANVAGYTDKVGIGTATPTQKLEVNGNTSIDGILHMYYGTTAITGLQSLNHPIIYTTDGDGGTYPFNEFGNLIFEGRNSGGVMDMLFYVGNKRRLSIFPTETVINDESEVHNFRVESDNDANAFFVNGTSNNVGIGTATPEQLFTANGISLFKDAVYFTQTDGNEYIDSLADGYVDIGATTGIRLNQYTTIDANSVSSCLRLLSTDAANDWTDLYVTAEANLVIHPNGGVVWIGDGNDTNYALGFLGTTTEGALTYYPATGRFGFSHGVTVADPGSLLASPVAGTFEFDNDRMYVTNVATQRAIDRTSGVKTETTSVTNTTNETTIFTESIPANSLKVGNVVKFRCSGIITNATASDDLEISGYLGSTLLGTFDSAIGNLTDEPWNVYCEMTVRSIGATGSIVWYAEWHIGDFTMKGTTISTIDTTAAEDFTVTITWDNAKAGNIISLYQGFMEHKN